MPILGGSSKYSFQSKLFAYYLCTGSLAAIPMLSVAHSNVDATIVPQYLITGQPIQCGYLSNSIAKLFKLFEI